MLYENKDNFNHFRNVPEICYIPAIKSIVPLLTKNGDALAQKHRPQTMSGGPQRSFKIGWTLSKQAKIQAQIIRKRMEEGVKSKEELREDHLKGNIPTPMKSNLKIHQKLLGQKVKVATIESEQNQSLKKERQ
jgi:hypothetical protein